MRPSLAAKTAEGFKEPLTISEYASNQGIKHSTARMQVRAALKAGTITHFGYLDEESGQVSKTYLKAK